MGRRGGSRVRVAAVSGHAVFLLLMPLSRCSGCARWMEIERRRVRRAALPLRRCSCSACRVGSRWWSVAFSWAVVPSFPRADPERKALCLTWTAGGSCRGGVRRRLHTGALHRQQLESQQWGSGATGPSGRRGCRLTGTSFSSSALPRQLACVAECGVLPGPSDRASREPGWLGKFAGTCVESSRTRAHQKRWDLEYARAGGRASRGRWAPPCATATRASHCQDLPPHPSHADVSVQKFEVM